MTADPRAGRPAAARPVPPAAPAPTAGRPARRSAGPPRCNRCNFPVLTRPWGCKNPCPNCGTVYPLGDCSD